jgi:hypothetical protein
MMRQEQNNLNKRLYRCSIWKSSTFEYVARRQNMQRLKWLGKLAAAGSLAVMLAGGFGVGQAAAAARKNPDVGVGIQRGAPGADGTVNYTITVVNTGDVAVKHVDVSVPFDATALQAVSGALASDAGYVTIGAGTVQIRTGVLTSDGDSVQAALHFRTLAGHAGAGLSERASYTWSTSSQHGSGVSNLPVAADEARLAVHADGKDLVFDGSIFGSGEGITFWYNTPDGRAVAMRYRDGYLLDADTVTARKDAHARNNKPGLYDDGTDHTFADRTGTVTARLSTTSLAPGAYTLVARGNASGSVAIGVFNVQ